MPVDIKSTDPLDAVGFVSKALNNGLLELNMLNLLDFYVGASISEDGISVSFYFYEATKDHFLQDLAKRLGFLDENPVSVEGPVKEGSYKKITVRGNEDDLVAAEAEGVEIFGEVPIEGFEETNDDT